MIKDDYARRASPVGCQVHQICAVIQVVPFKNRSPLLDKFFLIDFLIALNAPANVDAGRYSFEMKKAG